MAREYDLSDPTDIEMLKSDFEAFSPDDWQEMIDYSLQTDNKKAFSYDERGCLMIARKKRLYHGFPSYKQMIWALKIADKIDERRQGGSE